MTVNQYGRSMSYEKAELNKPILLVACESHLNGCFWLMKKRKIPTKANNELKSIPPSRSTIVPKVE